MKGSTFKNYPDKSYSKLTGKEIAKHIAGEQLIGLYPLLTDKGISTNPIDKAFGFFKPAVPSVECRDEEFKKFE